MRQATAGRAGSAWLKIGSSTLQIDFLRSDGNSDSKAVGLGKPTTLLSSPIGAA